MVVEEVVVVVVTVKVDSITLLAGAMAVGAKGAVVVLVVGAVVLASGIAFCIIFSYSCCAKLILLSP